MPEWTALPLVRAIQLQRGHDLPSSRREEGKVPIIGSFGITGFHSEAKYAGPGVAIGRSGASIGGATYCPGDYWPLNTCLFVADFKGNDPRWVYYLLDSIDFTAFNSGSAQPSLNRNYLADIPVAVPPIEEQRAIAATLGALDDRIESNRRIEVLGLTLLDAMSEQVGEALPEVPIGEVAAMTRETVKPGEFGAQVVEHFSLPSFDTGARADVVAATSIMSSKIQIPGNCVLVSRLNPRTNRTWWVTTKPGTPALSSTEWACLTAHDRPALAGLWLAVRDPFFRQELTKRVTGTSGSHQRVRPDDLLSIPVPDVRGLARTTTLQALSVLDEIEHKRSESAVLANLRDALLPELLCGRTRVAA